MFGALLLCATAPFAYAVTVERVVAVVGERPIFLSELRQRARPFLMRIYSASTNPGQLAAAESEMFRDLLKRMVDDRLEDQAADKAHLSVAAGKVDDAMSNIAANAKLTVPALIAEAKSQGLSEQDYREEIRRQLLEGQLVQLRVRGRVRPPTDDDARLVYTRWVKDISGDDAPVDISVLALRIGAAATPADIENRGKLAQAIVNRARAGEDFCALIKQYADDEASKKACGSRGPQPVTSIIGPLQDVVRGLQKKGDVSAPTPVGSEALVIVRMNADRHVPTFEEVKPQMMERAYGEALERERRAWLDDLRRGLYVDIRL